MKASLFCFLKDQFVQLLKAYSKHNYREGKIEFRFPLTTVFIWNLLLLRLSGKIRRLWKQIIFHIKYKFIGDRRGIKKTRVLPSSRNKFTQHAFGSKTVE